MAPKITIIMATYNRSEFILESLQSIQNQSFEDWECLIVDDGGIDNTIEIITLILTQDSRFHFSKRPDIYKKGLPGCRNYGLDVAKGEYIIFFDDDDIVHPDNLKTCIDLFEDSTIDFCHYQKLAFEVIKPLMEKLVIKKKLALSKADLYEVVTQKIGLASCTVMWKKECFDKERFNESLLYAEEWECYSRLIAADFKGIQIETVLYYNRKHAQSNTGEFYRNNLVRRKSKADAIFLVVKNLKEKHLLSKSLLRYLLLMSITFKEFNLFHKIINDLELSKIEKFKWLMFYRIFPLRFLMYRITKRIKNNL